MPGTAPGSMIVDPNASPTIIRVMAFGGSEFLEKNVKDIAEIRAIMVAYRSVWIDVIGLGSQEKTGRSRSTFETAPVGYGGCRKCASTRQGG